MVQTLNTIGELKHSEFGRPSPRHGLKLLYWFAKKYIDFDDNNQMYIKNHPNNGDFGFHHFMNRQECENNICIKLLPENYQYYEVGNLHLQASYELPAYVREDYTGKIDRSNMDRVIISLCQNLQVGKVYVTQHEDEKRFDEDHTYRISRGLLMVIDSLSLDDFLKQAGYVTQERPISDGYKSPTPFPMQSRHTDTVIHVPQQSIKVPQQSNSLWDTYCTIL